jgi:hypothetical protein
VTRAVRAGSGNKLLHERAGLALESMFAGQLDDHLDELARHGQIVLAPGCAASAS